MAKRSTDYTFKIKGVVSFKKDVPILIPVSKGDGRSYFIKGKSFPSIREGDLVDCIITRKRLRHAKIIRVLSKNVLKKKLNHLTLWEKDIPNTFSEKTILESDKIKLPPFFDDHKDLTHLPFVTVDPHDAKDHDDAICVLKGIVGKDTFCFKVFVAIADVSFFVKENSEIDSEARTRGNSTYLPNLCIPMLPEKLSFNICSLLEDEIRPCLIAEININKSGKKTSHQFHRAIIKNNKALTYEDLEALRFKKIEKNLPYFESINNLWDLYELLMIERKNRSPLDFDLPEKMVKTDGDDNILDITNRKRNDSNQLIEELMILANICAAETIKKFGKEMIFRIHPAPSNEKIESFRNFTGVKLPRSKNNDEISPAYLNSILNSKKDSHEKFVDQQSIVKLLEQAKYSTRNEGHFGLNLGSYAHFTSPIRRYGDIVIHRLLIDFIIIKKPKQITKNLTNLKEVCDHINFTERRSSDAERETIRRYVARYMRNKTGQKFEGKIIGFIRKIIFIKIDYLDSEGIIILKRGMNDSIYFDKVKQHFFDKHSMKQLNIGSKISVTLTNANELNGSLTFKYNC